MRLSTSVRRVRCASLGSAAALTCATTSLRRATAASAKNITACVGRLTSQQLNRLGQQCVRNPVAPAGRATEHIAQQPDSTFGRSPVFAQQDDKARLRLKDPGKPEQLVFDLVDPILACGDFQQRLPRHVFDGVDQIRVGRPALRNGRPQQFQRGIADFAG